LSEPDAIANEARFFTDLIPAAGVDSELGLNIIRAGRLLSDRAANYLRGVGMSEAQFNLLIVLEGVESCLMQTEVAQRMLVSRANICGLVKGMLAKGWIASHPVADDRRATRLTLAKEGAAILEAILPGHFEYVHQGMEPFSDDEKKQLITLLTRLRGHLVAQRSA